MKSLREISPLPENGAAAPLIVHVVRQFWPSRGGLEDVVYNLGIEALRRGYRIRVVTLNSVFAEPERVLKDREMHDGIEIVRIGWTGTSRYPLAPSVLRHIADADIVHVHAVDFFFDFLAQTKFLHRKTLIATTHGGFFHTNRFGAIKKVWFQTLTRFSAARYAAIVGCSQSDTELFRKIAPNTTRMIENGTDIGKFANAASSVPRRGIVTIGRFSVNKRLDRLIAMMAPLVRRDPQWHLDILGVPSDLTALDLQRLIAENGVQNNVQVHVGLANSDMRGIMRQSSVFASASEYEGFGLAAIEAMSAGLVPVLHPNDAFKALAAKHATIRLVDYSDSEAAAEKMQATFSELTANSTSLPLQLRADAAVYSWPAVAGAYFRLYDEITAVSAVR